jgi:hypothetical protein
MAMGSLADLMERWATRDVRYQGRRRKVSVDEGVAILIHRRAEALALGADDRDKALSELRKWEPPEIEKSRFRTL